MGVPGRNRTLFHCIFRPHYCVQSTIAQYFHWGQGSYMLCRYSCIFVARMSPALNGSFALQRFECGNTVELRNGIMFDFYPGLPHRCGSLYVLAILSSSIKPDPSHRSQHDWPIRNAFGTQTMTLCSRIPPHSSLVSCPACACLRLTPPSWSTFLVCSYLETTQDNCEVIFMLWAAPRVDVLAQRDILGEAKGCIEFFVAVVLISIAIFGFCNN